MLTAGGKGGGPWEAVGIVVQITAMEEVALQLRMRKGQHVPSDQSLGFAAELTWNSTSYDRMQVRPLPLFLRAVALFLNLSVHARCECKVNQLRPYQYLVLLWRG